MICKERLGSGGDGGIDSAFLFVNGVLIHEDTDLTVFGSKVEIELIVIQSKRSKGFSESTIQKLRSSLDDLLNLSTPPGSLSSTYNADVISFELFHHFEKQVKTLIDVFWLG